jgi:WD40 repeat protein
MPSRKLPSRPDIQHYKNQAKALLKSYRLGDPEAVARVRRHHPGLRKDGRTPTAVLADAQWVIAREHGFESWPKFAGHIAASDAAIQLEITTAEINLCVFMRDGRFAATSAEGNAVRVWDARTGRSMRAFEEGGANVWGLAATGDAGRILIGGRDGAARLFDVESGQLLRTLSGHRSLVRCVDLSADSRLALTGEMRDPRVRLWDVEAERCTQMLDGHTDGIYDVAFDPTGRRALSGSRDTTLRLWDLANGRCPRVFEGHTYHVHSVAWRVDGRRALSCSQDIRLWDLENGRCLRVFTGHTQTIRSVAWSPDYQQAVSAAHDRTVRVWDVESGACRHVFEGHSAGVVTAVWSSTGRRIHSCDWNGEMRTWPVG